MVFIWVINFNLIYVFFWFFFGIMSLKYFSKLAHMLLWKLSSANSLANIRMKWSLNDKANTHGFSLNHWFVFLGYIVLKILLWVNSTTFLFLVWGHVFIFIWVYCIEDMDNSYHDMVTFLWSCLPIFIDSFGINVT